MLAFKILLLLVVICDAKIPKITYSTKTQPKKSLTEFSTFVKFHYVLRCENRPFKYHQDSVTSDDSLGTHHGPRSLYDYLNEFDAAYGFFNTHDDFEFGSHYEFALVLRHTCTEDGAAVEWTLGSEKLKCNSKYRQCQFFYEINLEDSAEIIPDCSRDGVCDVKVEW